MKLLLINKLSLFTLLVAIFFRVLNFKILFINIEYYFKKKKLLSFLSSLNIKWCNYQDHPIDDVETELMSKTSDFSNDLSSEIINIYWSPALQDLYEKKAYLTACLGKRIYYESWRLNEILFIAKKLKNKNNQVFLWIPNTLILKKLNTRLYNFKNLNFLPNTNVDWFFKNLINVFKIVFNIKLFKDKKNSQDLNDFPINYDDYKIACYPNKGVCYGDMYIKDFFYSNKENDPFFSKKLLHLEWEKSDLSKKSLNYYKKNNIQNIFIKNFYDKRKVFKETVIFLFKNIFFFLRICLKDFQIGQFFLTSIFQISRSTNTLNKIKSLKMILVCHDELFPTELSIACKKKKNNYSISTRSTLCHVSSSIFNF